MPSDQPAHTSSNLLIADLRARGIRITPQRAIILDAIQQMPGHLTAEAVFAAVQQVSAYINLATVYRTLDLLRDLNLITEADMGTGVNHFALHTHGLHHHAVCRVCGRTFEFPHRLLEPLIQSLQNEFRFAADANHVVIFGCCERCGAHAEDVIDAPSP